MAPPEGEPKGAVAVAAARRRPGTRKEDWIGSQLRHVYDEALQEGIPDNMIELLNQLDEAAGRREDGAS